MTTETLNFPIFQKDDAPDAAEMVQAEAKSVAESTDFELAQRASGGDMAAFDEIYQRHHRRVYSICLLMLQNAYEA